MNILDKKRELSILNSFEVQKAYTEGIYADTPANRKLGRVGMSYADYAKKLKDDKEEQQKTNPVNEKMKKTIQSFLRNKDINSFQLGYGGYLFSNKDSKGNYGKLSLSMIREQDLESIKEMLHKENINYKVENKVISSQKGMIKDISFVFDNKEQKNNK